MWLAFWLFKVAQRCAKASLTYWPHNSNFQIAKLSWFKRFNVNDRGGASRLGQRLCA